VPRQTRGTTGAQDGLAVAPQPAAAIATLIARFGRSIAAPSISAGLQIDKDPRIWRHRCRPRRLRKWRALVRIVSDAPLKSARSARQPQRRGGRDMIRHWCRLNGRRSRLWHLPACLRGSDFRRLLVGQRTQPTTEYPASLMIQPRPAFSTRTSGPRRASIWRSRLPIRTLSAPITRR
jgi:hypothetical protein